MSFGALMKYTDCFWTGVAVRLLKLHVIAQGVSGRLFTS